jgi:hypothetical protein
LTKNGAGTLTGTNTFSGNIVERRGLVVPAHGVGRHNDRGRQPAGFQSEGISQAADSPHLQQRGGTLNRFYNQAAYAGTGLPPTHAEWHHLRERDNLAGAAAQ